MLRPPTCQTIGMPIFNFGIRTGYIAPFFNSKEAYPPQWSPEALLQPMS